MKYAAAMVLASAAAVNAGFCADAINEGGNFFCPNAVKQIKYTGLDGSGKYRAVSKMDSTGTCTFEDKTYSGPIAPFDEELSMHIRGPFQLKQFAVYTPSSQKSKRDAPKAHSKRHGHQHLHKKHAQEKRGGDIVTATINGVVQTWENNWFGGAATTKATEVAAATTAAATSYPESTASPSQTDDDDVIVPEGDFARVAYYNSASQVADGVTFLANKGDPSLSGTWDGVWGNSLSYVNSDGASCAASPTVLGDITIGDGDEIAIYSDKECDDSCGAYRPGSVAYKGWSGATKIFVMEFSMPSTGATGWNLDMPAAWLLNAAIARTGQYSSCSCWKGDNNSPNQGGCGEADIFEVLASGDTKAKSTFHFAEALGDSHYFDRPTSGTIKVATIFQASSSTATIRILDDTVDFSTSLTSDQINDMVKDENDSSLMSLMSFGSW